MSTCTGILGSLICSSQWRAIRKKRRAKLGTVLSIEEGRPGLWNWGSANYRQRQTMWNALL